MLSAPPSPPWRVIRPASTPASPRSRGRGARAALGKGAKPTSSSIFPRVRRATADAIYNVWTHAYGIQALVRMLYERATVADDGEKAEADTSKLIERPGRSMLVTLRVGRRRLGLLRFPGRDTASPSSDSISFTTATMPGRLPRSGDPRCQESILPRCPSSIGPSDSINRQRKSDHSYLYGEYLDDPPMRGINRPGGSLGRSQACNHCPALSGATRPSPMPSWKEWLDPSARPQRLARVSGGKRPVPHESVVSAVAGYFYYYGHYYAARCVSLLPAGEQPEYRKLVADLIVPKQEADGSWWDFPFYTYHQPYGTAFAVMTLARCRENDFSF
jgi:hypothetical protein